MQRTIILTVAAVAILAGAYPTQAHAVIDQLSIWLEIITSTVGPGQQTAILVIVGLLALAALTK
ncbi:MAG: hypothetical protein AB7R40_22490 [Nitrospiraceae bacterium]